jgi:hypothetical protein
MPDELAAYLALFSVIAIAAGLVSFLIKLTKWIVLSVRGRRTPLSCHFGIHDFKTTCACHRCRAVVGSEHDPVWYRIGLPSHA